MNDEIEFLKSLVSKLFEASDNIENLLSEIEELSGDELKKLEKYTTGLCDQLTLAIDILGNNSTGLLKKISKKFGNITLSNFDETDMKNMEKIWLHTLIKPTLKQINIEELVEQVFGEDDAPISFDNERLDKAIENLTELKRQVCRVSETLKDVKAPVSYIKNIASGLRYSGVFIADSVAIFTPDPSLITFATSARSMFKSSMKLKEVLGNISKLFSTNSNVDGETVQNKDKTIEEITDKDEPETLDKMKETFKQIRRMQKKALKNAPSLKRRPR